MRSTSLCASEYLRLSTNHLEHRSNVVAPQRVRFFSFYRTGSLTGWIGGEGRGREGERRPRAGRQTVEHGANPWQPQKSNNLNTKSFRIGCKKFQIKNLDTGLCPNSYLKLWNNFGIPERYTSNPLKMFDSSPKMFGSSPKMFGSSPKTLDSGLCNTIK